MKTALQIIAGIVLTSGCNGGDEHQDEFCDTINENAGQTLCKNVIQDSSVFNSLALRTEFGPVVKYISPAKAGTPFPVATYIETKSNPLHLEFLKNALPSHYETATNADYRDIFFLEEREYLSGYIVYSQENEEWTFSVLESPGLPSSFIDQAQAVDLWEKLRKGFKPSPLKFAPTPGRQESAAETWTDLPFETVGLDSDYQAYNLGKGCGNLKFIELESLDTLLESGGLGFRDIVVFDSPPPDLERVVSGIVTSVQQGPLSHLAVRSASRGTPNVYIRDSFDKMSAFENKLICIDVEKDNYSIRETTLSEAEDFWQNIRPAPVNLDPPNLTTTTIESLTTLATNTPQQRQLAKSTYGAKATNLATLYQNLSDHNSYKGLLVPGSFYDRFINENSWNVDLGAGQTSATFQETINAWLADPDFRSNTVLLRQKLTSLRQAMEEAPVPSDIVDQITQRIALTYGNDTTMVRFRSSSNAEDALGFSGAGLYESTNGCAKDQTDTNTIGPSHCDSDISNERTVERALKRVWSSVWKMSAFDERDWYGIDHSLVMMAVLINDRAKNEAANIVAFSQNPLGAMTDDRLLLTAQIGSYDLVSPEPGVRPEQLLLSRDNGQVTEVNRVSFSTVTGNQVISDAQATQIGNTLIALEQSFPLDESPPSGSRVILDTEWKVLENNELVIKQIRPFLDAE